MAEIHLGEPRPVVTPLPDLKFWVAHSKWKALRDDWDAVTDDNDREFDRRAEAVHSAFCEMWLVPIRSAYALAAKLQSCNFQEVDLPAPAGNTTQMLKWDLNRMVMHELGSDPKVSEAELKSISEEVLA